MSAPFTLTAAEFYQPAKLDELRKAYSQRSVAMNGFDYHNYLWQFQSPCMADGVADPAVYFYEYLSGGYKKFSNSGWSQGNGTASDALQTGTAISTGPSYGYFSPSNGSPSMGWLTSDFFSKIQAFIALDAVKLYCNPDSISSTVESPISQTFDAYADYFEYLGENLYADAQNYGFRRAYELDENRQPIMTRGMCRQGDIMGPWIIEDLLACFSKLTHTRTDIDLGNNDRGHEITVLSSGARMVWKDGDTWHDETFDFEGYHAYFDPYYETAGQKYYGYSTQKVTSKVNFDILNIDKWYYLLLDWNPRTPGTNPPPTSTQLLHINSNAQNTAMEIGNGTNGGDIQNQNTAFPIFVVQWNFTNV